MEIFKDIPDYEGIYQVSNLGRVKSLERTVTHSSGSFMVLKERFLTLILNAGYYNVNLSKHGKPKAFNVHVLVAMTFLNHTPRGMEIVVDHIDNDKLNNNTSNLQLTSNRHNTTKDRKGGSSEYIGVSWSKANSKWRAAITLNGKTKYLGYYTCELKAAEAYQNALKNI